jgi:hypothetical protein
VREPCGDRGVAGDGCDLELADLERADLDAPGAQPAYDCVGDQHTADGERTDRADADRERRHESRSDYARPDHVGSDIAVSAARRVGGRRLGVKRFMTSCPPEASAIHAVDETLGRRPTRASWGARLASAFFTRKQKRPFFALDWLPCLRDAPRAMPEEKLGPPPGQNSRFPVAPAATSASAESAVSAFSNLGQFAGA